MGLGLMVYSYYVGKKRHYVGREQKAPAGEVLKTGKDALLALIMPVIIIGGIMSGIFTATESGAIACVYSLIIGIFVYREQVSALLTENIGNKYLMLLVINAVLLVAGTFIDTTSALVIFTPLFLPIVQGMGIDLLHFGLVMTVNLTIGMCTPPLGVCLFVSGTIAEVSLKDQMRDLLPMLAVLLIVLLIITYIPETVTFLPNLIG